MKMLLMATDLSARSDRALERAIALAHDHDADLTVVDLQFVVTEGKVGIARDADRVTRQTGRIASAIHGARDLGVQVEGVDLRAAGKVLYPVEAGPGTQRAGIRAAYGPGDISVGAEQRVAGATPCVVAQARRVGHGVKGSIQAGIDVQLIICAE